MPEKKVAKVVYHTDSTDTTGTVWMDVTQKTVTTNNMLSGITSLKNDGTDITGNIASKTSSNLSVSGATITAAAGYYASSASASVASGTAGTPTATKGTVSNHQVSITPSVTNTTGYITGSTKTGTAVSVSASELVSGNKAITANGTDIDVANYATVSVNVASDGPTLQAKTGITPTESSQTITYDEGYDGLSSVQINAISSTYVGSGITSRSSSDLTVSGATVTAPAGYYASSASKSVSSMTLPTYSTSNATSGYISKATISRSTNDLYINIPTGYNSAGAYYKILAVANGSATTPATTITANPIISVNSSGLITATVSGSQNITPTVSAGYVSSGTAGTVTVSGSAISQLSTQAAQTIYPSTSDQTISSYKYLTGTQTIKGVIVTGLTAANIVSGVTVKIGDSADDDRITSVTGTYDDSIEVVRLI